MQILKEPKNALLKQYAMLLGMSNAELDVTPAAMQAIAAEARKRGTGARGLRSLMEKLLTDAMYRVPDIEGRSIVILDEEDVVTMRGARVAELDVEHCCDAEIATGS